MTDLTWTENNPNVESVEHVRGGVLIKFRKAPNRKLWRAQTPDGEHWAGFTGRKQAQRFLDGIMLEGARVQTLDTRTGRIAR